MTGHLPQRSAAPLEQRRLQIIDAAMTCFARRGFHQTTMQDISQAAGISVGLIYRYFQSKEEMIATMASEHMRELQRKLDHAKSIANLFEALEHVVWCDQQEVEADIEASFVVDLFAESSRNPGVRELVSQVQIAVLAGVTELIAASPQAPHLAAGMQPQHAAELIFHTLHGLMFDEILNASTRTPAQTRQNRTETLRRLWMLLFPTLNAPASSAPATEHA